MRSFSSASNSLISMEKVQCGENNDAPHDTEITPLICKNTAKVHIMRVTYCHDLLARITFIRVGWTMLI
jgi:hypothetical protein